MSISQVVVRLLQNDPVATILGIVAGAGTIVTFVRLCYDMQKSRLEVQKLRVELAKAKEEAQGKPGDKSGTSGGGLIVLGVSLLLTLGATSWLTWTNARAAAEYQQDSIRLQAVIEEAEAKIEQLRAEIAKEKGEPAPGSVGASAAAGVLPDGPRPKPQ